MPKKTIRSAGPTLGGLVLLAGVVAAMTIAAASGKEADTVTIDDLEWARTTNGQDIRWPDAVDYCAGLELAGHDDWRLPTMAELESLYDPDAEYGIRTPFRIDTCCLWSGESLIDRPAEDGDEIGGAPDMYHWGFLFDGGLEYYAVHIFNDGQALCVRN